MYADLFDQLGRSRSAATSSSVETPPVVAFKAGTIDLEPSSNDNAFTCTADTARGLVRLIQSASDNNTLKWQFYDRRRDTVVSTEVVPPNTTFTKVDHSSNKSRIFVWTRPASTPIYKMYWMQDADDSGDEDILKSVNEALKSAKAPASTTSTTTTGGSSATASSATDQQVDTLSSILENLGMPAPATTAATTSTNQLTLADLQGAMASIQEQQTQVNNLSEIITNESIQSLLDDEAVRNRLISFLPENQQSEEYLRDNLMSPSVRRSLMLLSNAIADDETYGSVIANFQLDPLPGQEQLAHGNPIAAFLDCITASVQQEDEGESKEEEDDEEMKEESKDESAKE